MGTSPIPWACFSAFSCFWCGSAFGVHSTDARGTGVLGGTGVRGTLAGVCGTGIDSAGAGILGSPGLGTVSMNLCGDDILSHESFVATNVHGKRSVGERKGDIG